MKQLCENCGYEFEKEDVKLEFDETSLSGDRWIVNEKTICDKCEKDLDTEEDLEEDY